MRIIGGKFRGRKILFPKTETVRPTKDRIREAVFNIIAEAVPGAIVLDIFAGSGAFGLEALSRGAAEAVFVDIDRLCSNTIKNNIDSLNIGKEARVITCDTFEFLEQARASGSRIRRGFGLVFSDPPYERGMGRKTLIMINCYDILLPSGLLIIEHKISETLPGNEGSISLLKQKIYGDIAISVYIKK
ncbi:MAG: 16S rRNA (guanine(966)-N(2))-methyltransferase RsmD [Candidatus Omnitrophota bacterium]